MGGPIFFVILMGGVVVFVLGYSAGAVVTVRRFERVVRQLRKHIMENM